MTEIAPLTPRPDVLDFLLTRRSRPSKTLTTPVPDRAGLVPLLALTVELKKTEDELAWLES